MWLIVSSANNDIRHTILGDHKYVIGRQNCDIVIPDASVSRSQAVLTMAHYETSVVKSYITPTLTLEDVSKFGTYVNGKAVKNPGGNTVTLKHNDEIKFGGSPASIFKAVYEPFVATTSCLEKAPKKSLIKVMCLLGGHLVRDWRPICDLLIMSKINVTIKVICAINNQKHIVTPQYLDALYSFMMGKCEKPDPVKYLPEVVDQEVPNGVSFHPDIRRVTLLNGLKFYFLSAVQFNKTNLAVSTAGGQPILLEDGTEEEAIAMTENKTVVVAVSRDILATLSPSCQKFVKLVISVLKRKNLRMVTDPEIGWAILTCNTVEFCNAKSSITPDMLSYMASQSVSQSTEADTTHSVRLVNVKPGKRTLTGAHNQTTSLMEDNKPFVEIVKSEVSSQPKIMQAVKTELKEELKLEVKKLDATGSSSDVMQISQGLGRKENGQSEQVVSSREVNPSQQGSSSLVSAYPDLSISEIATPALDMPIQDSTLQRQTALNCQLLASQIADTSGIIPKKVSGKNERRISEENNDEPMSVFARRQNKRKGAGHIINDSDDDELERKNTRTSNSKPASVFDDDFVEVSESKRRKTNFSEGIKQRNKSRDSNLFILSSDDFDHRSEASKTVHEEEIPSPHLSPKNGNKSNGDDCATSSTDLGNVHKTVPDYVVTGGEWLNMRVVKTKLSHELEADQNGDIDEKPDMELLRDGNGKPLRNLCEVQVIDLISRSVIPKVKSTSDAANVRGEKNFKKFKKTQHAGAGRLPVIIGGRDLEVYLGNKHKDIEDLFSSGLIHEQRKQEEDKREKDLFNWDDGTRKTSSKRIR